MYAALACQPESVPPVPRSAPQEPVTAVKLYCTGGFAAEVVTEVIETLETDAAAGADEKYGGFGVGALYTRVVVATAELVAVTTLF